jgi:hypothetical protein
MRGRFNTQKRLLWLRKQYRREPEVFIRTASVIGFLNSGDADDASPGDAYAHPQQMLQGLESRFRYPSGLAYDGPDLTLEDYARMIELYIRIGQYHEAGNRLVQQRGAFDKYVAWVAKVVNSLIKANRAGTLKALPAGVQRPVHPMEWDAGPPNAVFGSGYWSQGANDEWVDDARFLPLIQRIRLLTRSLPEIRDWAEAERVNLMGLTYQQAERRSNLWHRELQKQELAEGAEQGKVVWRFADGWTIQNLTKRRQLKQEGKALKHCVGAAPGYWKRVQQGSGRILSLRDADGRPQVTIQLDAYNFYPRDKPPPGAPDFILQAAKASKNARPSKQLADRIVYWLLRTLPEGKDLQSAGLDHRDLGQQSQWMVPNPEYTLSGNPLALISLLQKHGQWRREASWTGEPFALELAEIVEEHYPWAQP